MEKPPLRSNGNHCNKSPLEQFNFKKEVDSGRTQRLFGFDLRKDRKGFGIDVFNRQIQYKPPSIINDAPTYRVSSTAKQKRK